MEIWVVNLMRLGDLVQAGPVVRGLKKEYPQAHLTLVAMDVFQEPARLLPGVDRLLLFPSLALAEALDGSSGWPEAFSRLQGWFAEHVSPSPDLVVNLTPNLLGALFTLATGGKEARGLVFGSMREIYTFPAWATYALVVSKARLANPFNIVDLFVKGAGLEPDGAGLQVDLAAESQAEADAAIQALSLAPGTVLVGLCPGASAPARQWPPESFARMARLLSEAGPCHFVIFGSSSEKPLGEAIRSHLPDGEVTLCQGHTSLSGLAAYLKHLGLLVTNDTGPMHLAAGEGTPVVALFLATARAQDTGPAGSGHIVLEPDLDCHPCLAPCGRLHCHEAIRPETVAEMGLSLLKKSGELKGFGRFYGKGMRIYGTEIDPLGYQAYLPVTRHPLTRRDFWVWVHRLAWAAFLDGKGRSLETLSAWVAKVLNSRYHAPQDYLEIGASLGILTELRELAVQGENAACQMSTWAAKGSVSPEKLRQQMERFARIDAQLRRLAVEFPEFSSLIEFFFQEQRRPKATEVIPMTQELAQAYGNLAALGEVFEKTAKQLEISLPSWRGEGLAQEVAQEMQATNGRNEKFPPTIGVTPCW